MPPVAELDEAVYTLGSDIGDRENISKSYVCRTLPLALLALEIADAILRGRDGSGGEAGAARFPDPTSCGRAQIASVCAEATRSSTRPVAVRGERRPGRRQHL